MSTGMDLLRSQRGLMAKVATGLGLSRAAVATWDRVPAERVVAVEEITGIPRESLRPDLYRAPHAETGGQITVDRVEWRSIELDRVNLAVHLRAFANDGLSAGA